MADNIDEFVGITGASEDAARQVLDMCAGDLEQAVSLWFTDEELQRNLSNPTSAPPVPTSSRPTGAGATSGPQSTRSPIGREDENGVIHIDSDEDNDEDMDFIDENDGAHAAVSVARTAQEEEDAAMAQRLQEELYGAQAAADEDGVRAPMARTTETLIGPSGNWPGDDGGDVQAAVMEQLRRRRQHLAAASRNNPFGQSIWEDHSHNSHPAGSSNVGGQSSRAQRLAELFRPPYDLMAHMEWDEARDEGKEEKKWILVNLQNMSDFNCQALNRDIWKDDAIVQMVRENFIFLQYDKDDPNAETYVQFYFPGGRHENMDNYPHVGIIDPRTGEQVKTWSGIPFPSALDFHAQLAEFLDRYSLVDGRKNPVPTAKPAKKTVDVDRMTEEEMLEMALQNSLDTNGGAAKSNVEDPDELTKASGDTHGKGKEQADTEPMDVDIAAESSSPSPFTLIPSDQPHAEPTDPATSTRIQFRHPNGRVIRRFSLHDPVQRIYEWLKAEPLEGKQDVPFELKVMPQGHDLIEDLSKTISDSGLKNGTVMIEFIEE